MESTAVLFQLEGLPLSVNKKDIQTFFRDSNLTEDDISILKDAENGRCLGLAFVRFHTELEANVATRHCGVEIGGSRVAVKRTNFQNMVTTKKRMESADSQPTRRKISEPISVSPDRTASGLRSPTAPSHSRRSEERGRAIHRLPFQQVEGMANVREPVERKRNRSRSPHPTRAGGNAPSYQSRGSPHGSHSSGAHHEHASHRHEKVVRLQYGRDGLWGEDPRESTAQQHRSDSRSNHMESMPWSSSSSRGSGTVSERESRTRDEPRRSEFISQSARGSSVYRSHHMGGSDGVGYSGSRIRDLEESKGLFGRRSREVELLHGQSRDRALGAEDHRGYLGGRSREVEFRDRHSGSRSHEMEVRARHVGSNNREVEVRGGFSRGSNREVEVRGVFSRGSNHELDSRVGRSGSRNQETEVRGRHLGSRGRDVDVRGRRLEGRSSEEQDYRGHWGGHDGERGHSGRDLRDRESAMGDKGSLGRSRGHFAQQDSSGAMPDVSSTRDVKLMGFPDWFAFKEIRHMLGRSVTVVHGGIHFVADARRPTAFVTVDGDQSYENALKLDGLTIDKQCTLTVLGCSRPKPDGGRSEGDDLRRMLEKRREPRNASSNESGSRSTYTRKHSASPVPHHRRSREVTSHERSYSPGRAQKLADEFWGTGSHTDQHGEYPSTRTEGRIQSYPTQWQDENGHFMPDVSEYYRAEADQSLAHGEIQPQVESGFMEAAMEYPEYFTREELAFTGEHTQCLRYSGPFSSQPEFSEDIAMVGMSLDSVFQDPASDAIAHRPMMTAVGGGRSTPPASDSTLASVVHVVRKGKDDSIAMSSERSRGDGPRMAAREDTPTAVRCANLPASVVVTDILSFFQDHTVSYDNVRIQCDDKGQPTGKCFVTFPSYQQAVLAVRTCSNQRLKDKRIIVDLVL